MHPFSPMMLLTTFNNCYIIANRCSPLMAVPFRCPRLPWGLQEGWRKKCFFDLNHSMGTQVVNMSDCGSTLFSPETTFDEAVGLLLGCWYSSLALHYYQLIYQIFKMLIFISKECSRTLCEQRQILAFWCFWLLVWRRMKGYTIWLIAGHHQRGNSLF